MTQIDEISNVKNVVILKVRLEKLGIQDTIG
jgi:hypothetical protein